MSKWLIGLQGLILGLGTVFLVLILLIILITIMGHIVQKIGKKKETPAVHKPAPVKTVNTDNNEDEIIAAITAAIACIGQKEGKKFKIRSYRRV